MTLWHPTVSRNGFRSVIRDTDEASTGKWMVQISLPDIGLLWSDIEAATIGGRLLAVKKSTWTLSKKMGHELVCVYCLASDLATVTETLSVLRELGVSDELKYRSDLATFEHREDFLYSSTDFEDPAPKSF